MDEKINWRKSLATLLAGLGVAAASPLAHGARSEAEWNQAFTKAWQDINPKQRQELRQEEREWMQWRDSLPADQRERANVSHIAYLTQFNQNPELVELAKEDEAEMKQDGSWLVPDTKQEPASQANPAYEKGYQNALLIWQNGVTLSSPQDIEITAEQRAYRQGYQQEGPDRDAFVRGFCDGTKVMQKQQTPRTTAVPEPEATPASTPEATPSPSLEPFRLPMVPKGLVGGRGDVYMMIGKLPSGDPVASSLQDKTQSLDLQGAIWAAREKFNISKMSDAEIAADPKLHAEVQEVLDRMDQERKAKETRSQQQKNGFQNWMAKAKGSDPGDVEADYKAGYNWGQTMFRGRTRTGGGTPGPVQLGEVRLFCNTALFGLYNRGQAPISLSCFQKGFEQAVDDMWGIGPF